EASRERTHGGDLGREERKRLEPDARRGEVRGDPVAVGERLPAARQEVGEAVHLDVAEALAPRRAGRGGDEGRPLAAPPGRLAPLGDEARETVVGVQREGARGDEDAHPGAGYSRSAPRPASLRWRYRSSSR